MKPIPREYQAKAKQDMREAYRSGAKRIVLRSEVGTGKTTMFSDLIDSLLLNGKKAMVVTNRKKLVAQAAGRLREFELSPQILMQSKLTGEPPLVVASADTLRQREWPTHIDFVIIDECHLANFTYVLEECIERGLWVLGVSATPIPNKSNRLHEFYQKMICTKRTEEHMAAGELEFDSYYIAQDVPDTSALHLRKTAYGMDYSERDLYALYNRPKMYDNMIENWLKMAKGKRTVCFCVSVEHSKKTAENFRAHGISAIHLDGNSTDGEREEAQELFEKGVYKILCNCAIFTFGWDCPSIECVIVNRATGSYELWRQMVGRGARPSPGKEGFLVIDQGGNYKKHGSLMDEVEWSLDPPKKRKKKEGVVDVAPRKSCPKCEALIPVGVVLCPVCGAEIPREEKKLAQGDFVLVQPKKVLTTWPHRDEYLMVEEYVRDCIRFQEGYKTREGKPMHKNAILHQIKSYPDAVVAYGKIRGYRSGWESYNKALS